MDYLLSRAAVEMDLKNDNSHHSGKRCHTQGQAVVNALNLGFRLCRSFFLSSHIFVIRMNNIKGGLGTILMILTLRTFWAFQKNLQSTPCNKIAQ